MCRHFAENVQYCSIAIGKEAAIQQKKDKNKRKQEGIIDEEQDLIIKSCALLNSGGGVLVMKIADFSSSTTFAKRLDEFWKTIEDKLTTLVKPSRYDDIFDRCEHLDTILLFINAPPHLCTIKYNLSLPGDSQVLDASYHQIISLLTEAQKARRQKLPNVTVSLKDLPKVPNVFKLKETLDLKECKQIQFKHYTSKTFLDSNNRTQREGVTKQMSAFANSDGGVILMGIDDNGEVCGLDLGENGKDCIERNLQENVINKMRWSLDPERRVHWDLKFFPVAGCEAKAIVVIFVAGMRNSGGTFVKSPSSFKLLPGANGEQSLRLIDLDEWKQRMLCTEGLQSDSKGMMMDADFYDHIN